QVAQVVAFGTRDRDLRFPGAGGRNGGRGRSRERVRRRGRRGRRRRGWRGIGGVRGACRQQRGQGEGCGDPEHESVSVTPSVGRVIASCTWRKGSCSLSS